MTRVSARSVISCSAFSVATRSPVRSAQTLLRFADANVHVAIVGFGALSWFRDRRSSDMTADRREIVGVRGLNASIDVELLFADGELCRSNRARQDLFHRHRRKHPQLLHRNRSARRQEAGRKHRGGKPGDEQASANASRRSDAVILDPFTWMARDFPVYHRQTQSAQGVFRVIGRRQARPPRGQRLLRGTTTSPPERCRTWTNRGRRPLRSK